MTFEQSVDFYERQANLLARIDQAVNGISTAIEQMEAAISNTVNRMAALLKMTEKTDTAANNLKNPMEGIVKNISGKGIGGEVNWGEILNPQNLVISLAIGVGWELFGDDIMTLLGPAMGVLESFAGVVHSVFATLAPVFTPVLWAAGLLTQILDYMAATMGTLLPAVVLMAGGMALLNAQTVAATISARASAAAAWIQAAASKAQAVMTNLMATAQKMLNTVMNASPMMRVVGVVMLLLGVLTPLIEKTGILKTMWEKITDFFSWVSNGLGKLFGKKTEITEKMTVDHVPQKQKMAEATMQTQEQAYSAMTPPTIPNYNSLLAQPQSVALNQTTLNQTALRQTAPSGSFGASAAGLMRAEPLRVETVGTLEGMTGPVTMSDETMGALQTMMAENRATVNVSPTVVINATVREETDIHKLVAGIERVLDEEFRAGAAGVYC